MLLLAGAIRLGTVVTQEQQHGTLGGLIRGETVAVHLRGFRPNALAAATVECIGATGDQWRRRAADDRTDGGGRRVRFGFDRAVGDQQVLVLRADDVQRQQALFGFDLGLDGDGIVLQRPHQETTVGLQHCDLVIVDQRRPRVGRNFLAPNLLAGPSVVQPQRQRVGGGGLRPGKHVASPSRPAVIEFVDFASSQILAVDGPEDLSLFGGRRHDKDQLVVSEHVRAGRHVGARPKRFAANRVGANQFAQIHVEESAMRDRAGHSDQVFVLVGKHAARVAPGMLQGLNVDGGLIDRCAGDGADQFFPPQHRGRRIAGGLDQVDRQQLHAHRHQHQVAVEPGMGQTEIGGVHPALSQVDRLDRVAVSVADDQGVGVLVVKGSHPGRRGERALLSLAAIDAPVAGVAVDLFRRLADFHVPARPRLGPGDCILELRSLQRFLEQLPSGFSLAAFDVAPAVHQGPVLLEGVVILPPLFQQMSQQRRRFAPQTVVRAVLEARQQQFGLGEFPRVEQPFGQPQPDAVRPRMRVEVAQEPA